MIADQPARHAAGPSVPVVLGARRRRRRPRGRRRGQEESSRRLVGGRREGRGLEPRQTPAAGTGRLDGTELADGRHVVVGDDHQSTGRRRRRRRGEGGPAAAAAAATVGLQGRPSDGRPRRSKVLVVVVAQSSRGRQLADRSLDRQSPTGKRFAGERAPVLLLRHHPGRTKRSQVSRVRTDGRLL